MSNRRFTWPLSYDTDQDANPRVNEAKFGDGYSQAVADGINALPRTWSLNFTYRSEAEATEIDDFLADHGGYDTFWWLSVIDGQPKRVLCRSWTIRHVGPLQYRVEARFEQRFDRDPASYFLLGFDDYTQTLLTPSDSAVLLPIEGDPAPTVPIPYLGLYLPDGGRIALEGADGLVAPLELPPGTWFTGMVPRRLRVTDTDSGIVVYGVSHPSVTALPEDAGDRVKRVLPSDTVNLTMPAVGGLYTATGGRFSYSTGTGVGAATVAPRMWWRDAVVTRVNAAGSDAAIEVLAFVRPLSIPLSPLEFSAGGGALLFDDYGTPLEFNA